MLTPLLSQGQDESDTLAPTPFIHAADQLHYMNDTAHWMVEIPLWIPGLRGALAYGDISIEIGGSGGDDGILKKLFSSETQLDYFMVGRVQYRWDRLFIDSDVYGGKINNSVSFIYEDQILLESQIELIIGRAHLGYTFIDHPIKSGRAGRIRSYAIAGLQISYAALDAILPEPLEPIHTHNTWYDPLVGAGLNYDIYRLTLGSRFDMGFRGVSTFSNWCFKTNARYRFGPRISVELGWIMSGVGGKQVVNEDELLLEVRLNGPIAGLSFHF